MKKIHFEHINQYKHFSKMNFFFCCITSTPVFPSRNHTNAITTISISNIDFFPAIESDFYTMEQIEKGHVYKNE
jgi:hypothetical protein